LVAEELGKAMKDWKERTQLPAPAGKPVFL